MYGDIYPEATVDRSNSRTAQYQHHLTTGGKGRGRRKKGEGGGERGRGSRRGGGEERGKGGWGRGKGVGKGKGRGKKRGKRRGRGGERGFLLFLSRSKGTMPGSDWYDLYEGYINTLQC